MIQMSPKQLEFWRALCAPFAERDLSVKKIGGTDLTYIDKRSLSNRLDTVCGPHGWYPEYRDAGGRGLICKLHILVPTSDNVWLWISKEDGGGDESMTKKVAGNQVEDVDNNLKSEFTNAFRRAAQDAWGIGRYLYQKGVPAWCDENAAPEDALKPQGLSEPATPSGPRQQRAEYDDAPAERTPAPNRIDIPAVGPPVYKWAVECENRFKTSLLNGMRQEAERLGLNKSQIYAWPQDMVNRICYGVIGYIRGLDTYRGEFDHIAPPVDSPSGGQAESRAAQPASDSDLMALKRELLTKLGALIEKQMNRAATPDEIKAAFESMASASINGNGNQGEIPDGLKVMTDAVWLRNIINLADENLRKSPAISAAEAADLPF